MIENKLLGIKDRGGRVLPKKKQREIYWTCTTEHSLLGPFDELFVPDLQQLICKHPKRKI